MSHYRYIWQWDKNRFLIETNSPDKVMQINKWSFVSKGPSSGVKHYRRQFFIPTKKVRLAHKLLGLEYNKNSNRINAGKLASQTHPITRDQSE